MEASDDLEAPGNLAEAAYTFDAELALDQAPALEDLDEETSGDEHEEPPGSIVAALRDDVSSVLWSQLEWLAARI